MLKSPKKSLLTIILLMLLVAGTIIASYLVNKPKEIQVGLGAIPGDVNSDGVVDIIDFQLLSNSFGKTSGQSGYNVNADFNHDNVVDILDFQVLSNNFGHTGTTTFTPTTRLTATPTPANNPSPTSFNTITPLPTYSGSTATIIAVGDIACGADSAGAACKEWATSEIVRQTNPNAVLILGDNQYEAGQLRYFNGSDPFCQSNPPRCYNATWGRFKSITHPSVGNHEYGTPGASGYFDYFNGVGSNTGSAGDRTKGYYSYDLGSWHFIVLNSNCSSAGGCNSGSPQEVWLRQDLQNHPNSCTLAYFHHPKFNSGHDGNNTTLTAQYTTFWQDLYNANADVILVGHAHDYERFAPQSPSGVSDNSRGIREFVVGTGGRNFTGWWGTAANSQIRNNTTFGVLKMTLHSSSYDWQFIPISGSTFTDSGSTNCH